MSQHDKFLEGIPTLLQKTQEIRLDQLYQTKCNDVSYFLFILIQKGFMDITQFFLFVIERNMLSNKNGIEIFYTAFKEASGGPDVALLTHTKFHYAIKLLAKTLFYKEESPMEAMFA